MTAGSLPVMMSALALLLLAATGASAQPGIDGIGFFNKTAQDAGQTWVETTDKVVTFGIVYIILCVLCCFCCCFALLFLIYYLIRRTTAKHQPQVQQMPPSQPQQGAMVFAPNPMVA